MVANRTIGPKIDLLKQAGLSKLKGKQRIETFTNIVIVLTRFTKERNLAVHGKWSPGGAGVTLGALAMIGNQKPMAASSHKKKGQAPKAIFAGKTRGKSACAGTKVGTAKTAIRMNSPFNGGLTRIATSGYSPSRGTASIHGLNTVTQASSRSLVSRETVVKS
jgi:hypothetical protein